MIYLHYDMILKTFNCCRCRADKIKGMVVRSWSNQQISQVPIALSILPENKKPQAEITFRQREKLRIIFLIRILNYALVMVRHPVLEGLSSKNGGDRGLGYHGGRRQGRKEPDIFVFEFSPKTLSVVWLLNILVQCCVVS